MPKLPAITPEELVAILLKRGFVLDRTRGSHRIYYHLESKRRVVVPFHRGDLPRGTLLEILRRAGLTKDEFGELR